LLASRRVKPEDLQESSPDHLGEALEVADNKPVATPPAPAATRPSPVVTPDNVVPAALKEREPAPPPASRLNPDSSAASPQLPVSGTVVLDVEQGGIVVPSFLGKSVRAAIEIAEASGLEVDVIGSGIAREQSPPPGSHVAAGARIVVKFER
jgi:PASTA domain-containing protein